MTLSHNSSLTTFLLIDIRLVHIGEENGISRAYAYNNCQSDALEDIRGHSNMSKKQIRRIRKYELHDFCI